jgi:anti-sigma28 factor (negative regulator of flagellin synthesis)
MFQDEKMTGELGPASKKADSFGSATAVGSPGKTSSSRKKAAAPSPKVARIRKALAEGSYNVSASDVANKLIDRMLDHRPPGRR